MLHISYSQLSTLGINPLTGEACAYGMRILCDLNQEGVELMADYWGVRPYPSSFRENWNSRVNDKPAIASVMIAHDSFPELIRFALFRQGWQYVYGEWTNYTAFNDSDMEDNPALQLIFEGKSDFIPGKLYRNVRMPRGAEGSRNVHAMSERVV